MLHQHVFPSLSQELAENVDIGEGIGIGVAVHRKMRMRTLCLVFMGVRMRLRKLHPPPFLHRIQVLRKPSTVYCCRWIEESMPAWAEYYSPKWYCTPCRWSVSMVTEWFDCPASFRSWYGVFRIRIGSIAKKPLTVLIFSSRHNWKSTNSPPNPTIEIPLGGGSRQVGSGNRLPLNIADQPTSTSLCTGVGNKYAVYPPFISKTLSHLYFREEGWGNNEL